MAYYTGQDSYLKDKTDYTVDYDFMLNQKVTNTGNFADGSYDADWTYSPLKYWPNNDGDKLTFFAYSPYTTAEGKGLDGVETGISGVDALSYSLEYAVSTDPVLQTDLLWSDAATKDLAKQDIDEKVTLTFRHALSKIGFSIAAVADEVREDEQTDGFTNILDENTTITVKKVALVKGDHEYTITTGENMVSYRNVELAAGSGKFYSKGVLNLDNHEGDDDYVEGVADWTLSDTDASSYYLLSAANFVNEQDFVLKGGAENGSNVLAKLNNDRSFLMIIPQDFREVDDEGNEGAFKEGYNVYVEYEVATTDPDTADGDDSFTVTNKILSTSPLHTDFESGKQYNINLFLGMTSVRFDVEVLPWEETETNVDVPDNTQE